MRIGVVSHLFPTARRQLFGIFVKDELDHLARRLDVRLIAPVPTRNWLDRGVRRAENVTYPVLRPLTLSFPRWFWQRYYPASMAFTLGRSVCKRFFSDCDLVHAHNAFPDGVAAVKAFSGRMPVVITVHGSDINLFAMKERLRPEIVDALNRAKRIICVSTSLRDTVKRLGVTTDTEIIPNGVDTGLFVPGERTGACIETGLDPNRPRVLFVGNFRPVKGIEYLIRAMSRVLKSYPDCELVLIGAHPGTADQTLYRKQIISAGIRHAVRIVNAVPHEKLPQWMQASDLLVLPSLHEGFGLVAAESLACGRPVVATRSGGPEDIVENGLGVLVPIGDHEALGTAIEQVLEGNGIVSADHMAETIRSRYSFDSISERIVALYKKVLHE